MHGISLLVYKELTNMCMIYYEDKILVQDRLNPNWQGITFHGGL